MGLLADLPDLLAADLLADLEAGLVVDFAADLVADLVAVEVAVEVAVFVAVFPVEGLWVARLALDAADLGLAPGVAPGVAPGFAPDLVAGFAADRVPDLAVDGAVDLDRDPEAAARFEVGVLPVLRVVERVVDLEAPATALEPLTFDSAGFLAFFGRLFGAVGVVAGIVETTYHKAIDGSNS